MRTVSLSQKFLIKPGEWWVSEINGQARAWAAIGMFTIFATGVGVTFTWRVFDSLLEMARIRADIQHMSEQIEELKVEIRDSNMRRFTKADGDRLERRVDRLESYHSETGYQYRRRGAQSEDG